MENIWVEFSLALIEENMSKAWLFLEVIFFSFIEILEWFVMHYL